MPEMPSKSSRRRKWPIVAAGALLLLVIAWFVLTSGTVVKALVLPRVAAAIHADLKVDDVRLSPFSRLELRNVILSPTGGEPLVEAAVINVRYRLMKLIGGRIAIDEVELDQPQISVRQRADGGSDLTDWLASLGGGTKTGTSAMPGGTKTPQLEIGRMNIKGGEVRFTASRTNGVIDRLSVNSFQLAVDQIRNSAASVAKIDGVVKFETQDANGRIVDSLVADLSLDGRVDLGASLIPEQADVKLQADVSSAMGRFVEGNGLQARFLARGNMKRLDDLSLVFQRGGSPVGEVRATGGYDAAAGGGAFDIVISNLPPVVFELATLRSGLDFELSGFTSTNHLAISRKGDMIGANGGLRVENWVAKKSSDSTPPLDMAVNFNVEVEPGASRALVSKFDANARQAGRPLLSVGIGRPFHISWKGEMGSEEGSQLSVTLTNLNLADWRALSGPLPVGGSVSLTADAAAKEAGKQLVFATTMSLENGVYAAASNRVEQLHAGLKFAGEATSFEQVRVGELSVNLTRAGRPVLDMKASGSVDVTKAAAELQAKLSAELPALTAFAGSLPVSLGKGRLVYDGKVSYSTNRAGSSGTLRIDELAGNFAGALLEDVALVFPVEVSMNGDKFDWKIDALNLTKGGDPALRFNTSGQLRTTDLSGMIRLELPLINERLVNPFLLAYSPQQTLRSAEATVGLTGDLHPGGVQNWSLTSHSTNVVLVGTNGTQLSPPLATRAELELEVDLPKRAFKVTRWQGTLFADGRPGGQFDASGDVLPSDGRARLDLKISGVNEYALRPLALLLIGDRRVEQAQLEAGVNLDYQSLRPSRLHASVDLTNLKIADPAGGGPQALRSVRANFDASIVSNRLDIANSRLQTSPTALATNLVELSGWLDFAKAGALKGALAARSPGFDATPVYALLRKTGVTNAPVNPASTSGNPAESAPARPAIALPVDRLDLSLDVRHFHLGEMAITNWLAATSISSNAVDVKQFSLTLNNAPVNARLLATNTSSGIRYDLANEVEQLPVEPLIKTFKPDFNGRAQALVSYAVHLNGIAKPGESPLSAATGDIYFGTTNANYEPFGPRWQNALRPVGLLLQTPELFSSPVTWAYGHAAISNKTLNVENLTIISDAYVMDASTKIPVSDDFVSSTIPRTPIDLYLSRNLITQLGLLKSEKTNEVSRYVQLPTFVHLSGTLGEPKVETDKLKMTGMAVGKAGDFVGGTAGDVLKKAGGVTEGLGDLLSGRKKTDGEKQDGNVVSKGLGGVLDALGGILGGAGNAVEKGTGVVTGTKVVEQDVLTARMAAFNWPRQFTNAPNVLPATR